MIIQILKKNPEYRTEKDLTLIEPLIKEIKFFKDREIHGQHLQEICMELKYEHMNRGDFVFRQGDYGDKFYIILKGKV
jgi:hypothetical protein